MPHILHQEDDVVVVHKPAGWLVHAVGTEAPDLGAWLKEQSLKGFSPAHRLDLPTSGPVVFARKNRLPDLQKAFAEHTVNKTYRALVFGSTRDKGRIARPLQDGRRGAKLDAETRYRTIERFGSKASLVELRPISGRKHQLRRHLQGIGHAVVGDTRYRPRGKPTVPGFPGRLWLHALEIEIGDIRVTDPLPTELAAHLELLKERL